MNRDRDPAKSEAIEVTENAHASINSTRSRTILSRSGFVQQGAGTNRRGVSVAHAFRSFNPASRLHAHPRPGGRHSLGVRRFLASAVNHEFQATRKRGRNRDVGSWAETGWREIALPFDATSLATLLEQAAGPRATECTHQDIAHWCDRFIMAARTGECPATDSKAASIAEDVSVQWELFLANTYSFAQLQALDFSEVRLPTEWFHDWLRRTHELAKTGDA